MHILDKAQQRCNSLESPCRLLHQGNSKVTNSTCCVQLGDFSTSQADVAFAASRDASAIAWLTGRHEVHAEYDKHSSLVRTFCLL